MNPSVLSHGFGEMQVPEMPSYTSSYSKRGNAFTADVTPVLNQARFGNRIGRGGLNAYVSQVEDPAFFNSLKQKKGLHGVYENLRWAPGYDWRGNFGIASLDQSKNFLLQTRGGEMRQGGPRRSDYVDRKDYWFETARPGIEVSRMPQNNNNYSGVYEWKRRTPFLSRENDMLVLREAIEHNPFFIRSHCAEQAKQIYDREFPVQEEGGVQKDVRNEDPHQRYV
jgi:hypothetical protein